MTLDPHGPNEMRCNGTLSNVPEFLEVRMIFVKFVKFLCMMTQTKPPVIDALLQAFGIQEGDKMYLPPDQRVDIW